MPHIESESKAKSIYLEHLTELIKHDLQPHEFVQHMMNVWETKERAQDRSVHGKYFEFVIGETLAQNGVTFLYYQANVLHVPLAKFDWFLYHESHPVSISCKAKARDRWKQAAHEGRALKHVYVHATIYLVTIERLSAAEDKLALSPFSIDSCVIANEPEYSDVVNEITQRDYMRAVDRSPIQKGKLISVQ